MTSAQKSYLAEVQSRPGMVVTAKRRATAQALAKLGQITLVADNQFGDVRAYLA